MISFLQNLLQKHHKWLFSMLLFVIVVAFVFTIGASPGIGRPLTKRRYFYGQDLSNAAEMTTIAENAIYAGLLESKDAGFARSNLDFFVAKRIIALWLANEFGIPNPSSENLGKYMRAMAIFIDESGKFSADLYASVLEILRRNGNGEDRLKQILCENYKIREVEAMLAGNGIAFNWQVMSHLARTETEYDLIVATLRKEDCKINENVNMEDVEKFYNEHPHRYVQPRMHAVSMVKFEARDFQKRVKAPSDEELSEFFLENRDAFPENAKFQDIKNAVHEAYIKAETTRMACMAAENFVTELYRNDVRLNSDEFTKTLAKFGVKKENVALYSKKKLPNVNGIGAAHLLSVCDLEGGRYYTDQCPATFGSVVLLLESRKEERDLSVNEAAPTVKEEIIAERRVAEFENRVDRMRRELTVATESGGDAVGIFRKNGINCETYAGISVNNADEKDFDPLYRGIIAHMKQSERVKVTAVGDDEALIFVVTGKKFQMADSVTNEKRSEVELALREFNRNFFLMDFFAARANHCSQ